MAIDQMRVKCKVTYNLRLYYVLSTDFLCILNCLNRPKGTQTLVPCALHLLFGHTIQLPRGSLSNIAFSKAVLLLRINYVFSVLFLLCFRARLFIDLQGFCL